jgi:hypothetical protein
MGPLWIASPLLDLLLFVGITLSTLGPWLLSDRLGVPGGYVLIAVAFVNGPHLISTWTRVYFDRRERFRRPFHYWVMPGVALAFAVGCVASGEPGPTLVRTTIFYWASWHFVAQSYGVLRIYQRKHGMVESGLCRLEKTLIFLPALFFVLHRLYTGPFTLFGSAILHPTPRAFMVNATGAAVLGVALVYVVEVGRRRLRIGGGAAGWVRPLYLACNAVGFYMPYLVIRDGTAAFAAAALWHAVQYLAIVWVYNRRRFRGGIDADARLLSFVSQPGRALAYLGVIAACALGVYALIFAASRCSWSIERWGLAVWSGLTLGHYYLDGVIWKFNRYDLNRQLVRA